MNTRVLFVLVSILLLAACTPKTAATGDDHEIIVFADDSTWAALEGALRTALQDTIQTPQPEAWFLLRREEFSRFGALETQKNRMVVGALDGTGEVSAFIRQSLGPDVRTLVENGKESVINKYDSKARGQLLMFLTGPTLPIVKATAENKATDLLYFFKNALLKRELASIASEEKYHKKEIAASLLARYGWTMTVQHDYFVAVDSAGGNFFWMRRANPADLERWIFVHWRDKADPRAMTDAFVIRLRDSLTKAYYKTTGDETFVEIAPYNLEIQTVDFLGRFAYEMRGNWRFRDKSGGGPFVNYTFFDQKTGRLYMIDGSVFAPRVEKKKLVLQVDGLLHTFKTEAEMTEEEGKELREFLTP